MSRQQSTNNIRLWWASSVANKSAPTTAEITAAVELTGFLKRDGLTTPKGGSLSDASDVSSAFNKRSPGTFGGDAVELKLYRDSVTGSDTAWSTLLPVSGSLPDGTAGFLIIRRFGGSSTAVATGNVVEVWPSTVNTREMQPIAENENQFFITTLAVTDEPDDAAVVA